MAASHVLHGAAGGAHGVGPTRMDVSGDTLLYVSHRYDPGAWPGVTCISCVWNWRTGTLLKVQNISSPTATAADLSIPILTGVFPQKLSLPLC